MQKRFFSIIVTLFFLWQTWAESTPIDDLYQYTLPNGLKVFVAENHNVPLTYIEIAIKCGAFTQERDTAGLFHLYEHMMFKGNALYPNAAATTRALSDMGVAFWNGTTDLECVNYYFTVPSNLTEEGLRFWSAAIRSPLLDKKELENEKRVVLSEIRADDSDPNHKVARARCKALFPDAPYKMSPGGDKSVVKKASVEQLRAIQKKYYVPHNAALFIGGDVKPDDVYLLVKGIYGDWEDSDVASESDTFTHTKEPLKKMTVQVMPYDKISSAMVQINVSFRGPDGAFDKSDTYTADVITSALSDPAGSFIQNIFSDSSLAILSPDYIWANYPTRRTAGVFSFGAVMKVAGDPIDTKVLRFTQKLNSILESLDTIISQSDVEKVGVRLTDSDIYSSESAEGLLGTLRFWWVVTDENYYYNYKSDIAKVTTADIKAFSQKYFIEKSPLVTVLINPQVYKSQKSRLKYAGFVEIK